MRQLSKLTVSKHTKFLLFALVIILAGCSLEKQSGFNRTMQNLTAHYNILFNAKEILRLKQVSYETSFVDNYNEILSVYQDTTAHTTTPDKDLELAITKANNIINVKEQSHYIGDAYLVLGKANFLEGNYFNAVEYFNYVTRSFPQRADLTQDALAWKCRTFMYLGQLPEAKLAIDSAVKNIDPKKPKLLDEIYATKLQYDINVQDYADGVTTGKLAVEHSSGALRRLRLTFIVSQVEELNKNQGEALKNYTQIAKSNASFEMAFNAALNRIRILDSENGVKESRTARLLGLLKDPNNKEFKDQIYYQVGEILYANKDIDGAIKNYKLSVRNSVKNQTQKGLSYLRLAQINFKNKADYLSAKKYYDSTLTSLPANYPGYRAIQKIGSNLQLLADRIQIITREDTLQALARMDEKTRLAVIDKMVNDEVLQQQAQAASAAANANFADQNSSGPGPGGGNGSTFYFYNSTAVSQGYTDFKKVWGNRKLEDNWRRSSRSGSDITNNQATTQGNDPDAPANQAQNSKNKANAGNYRQELMKGLPLTPDKLAASNLRVYNAYIDIANFYRDILDDKKEAIAEYEQVLRRFPNDANKAAIYYNLYRLYSEIDPAKSDQYKNILLKDYADTPFAKVISDPDYAKKLDDKEAEFSKAFEKIFDAYSHRKYNDVIDGVPQLLKQYPNNRYSAQLAYLKVISEGHNEKVQPFRDSLQLVVKQYPTDKLVTPLINQHLAFITANQTEMQGRTVVLADEDPSEIPFTLVVENKEKTEYRNKHIGPYIPPAPEKKTIAAKKPEVTPKPAEVAKATPPVKKSKADSVAKAPPQIAKITKPDSVAVKAPPQIAKTTKPDSAAKAPQAAKVSKTDSVAKPQQIAKTLKTDTAVTAPVIARVNKPDTTATPVQPPPGQQIAAATPTQDVKTQDPDQQQAIPESIKLPSIFNLSDSTNYFFVVNVASATTNLASSRFGIGQFNRVNYTGKGIKHQLMPVEDNQLIFVGRFTTLDGVKKYARQIAPLLPDIMKVPKDKYSFFIITQENLNKLADRKTLDSYVDFYQKNY